MTEAKDTVKNPFLSVNEQADISFKAGIEEQAKRDFNAMNIIKQDGRKEVVEWIKEHWISKSFHQDGTYEFLITDWEAQLKKWGIKEN